VTVIVSFPIFVSVAVCVAFWPTATLAKVMFSGLICTVACGVGLAFDELANPAHPLSPVEPHASTPNSPASAHLLLAVALNFCAAFPRARFGLAISFPSGFLVREADYGFDPCNKYW